RSRRRRASISASYRSSYWNPERKPIKPGARRVDEAPPRRRSQASPTPHASTGPRRQHGDYHQSLRQRRLIGQREIDACDHAGWRQRLEALQGAAGEDHARPAGRQVDDAEIVPIDAGAEAGAERLGACFLGGVALGVAGDTIGAAIGFGALGLGEDARQESLAEALDGPHDPIDVDEVAADAEDHRSVAQALFCPLLSARTLSISERMRL